MMNYTDLESKIDLARLDQRWDDAKKLIAQYETLFDIGSELITAQHSTIKEMKSYYWVCMSEVSFYTTGDFNIAIDSLRRATAFYYPSIDVRIIAARLVLFAFKETVRDATGGNVATGMSSSSNHGHVRSDIIFHTEDLELSTILGDQAKVHCITFSYSLLHN